MKTKFKPITMDQLKLTEKQMEILLAGARTFLGPQPDPADDEKLIKVDTETEEPNS